MCLQTVTPIGSHILENISIKTCNILKEKEKKKEKNWNSEGWRFPLHLQMLGPHCAPTNHKPLKRIWRLHQALRWSLNMFPRLTLCSFSFSSSMVWKARTCASLRDLCLCWCCSSSSSSSCVSRWRSCVNCACSCCRDVCDWQSCSSRFCLSREIYTRKIRQRLSTRWTSQTTNPKGTSRSDSS